MAKKKKTLNRRKRVRELARERVGSVKPSRPIEPKAARGKDRKPKHKRRPEEEGGEDNRT